MPIPKNDLLLAADWLDAYEDLPGGDVAPRMKAVADWLRLESDAQLVRTFARSAKVPAGQARVFLRKKGELAAAPEAAGRDGG